MRYEMEKREELGVLGASPLLHSGDRAIRSNSSQTAFAVCSGISAPIPCAGRPKTVTDAIGPAGRRASPGPVLRGVLPETQPEAQGFPKPPPHAIIKHGGTGCINRLIQR
jgi:hypothetical protein